MTKKELDQLIQTKIHENLGEVLSEKAIDQSINKVKKASKKFSYLKLKDRVKINVSN